MNSFDDEVARRVAENGTNVPLREAARRFMLESIVPKYSYNFAWQGRPIIQYPQDILAMQEVIWSTRPDLIIETGIAHGGSLIFSASMLAQLDLCDAIQSGQRIDPKKSRRNVLGIDIDIRAHNRAEIEAHPMASRIEMIEASSVAPATIEKVRMLAEGYKRILVCLDSHHGHDHVLAELRAYAPLTTLGSYCVVFDTIVEDVPSSMCRDRAWGPGNSPKTAVREFLATHQEFEVDKSIENKVLITVAPEGFLKRIR